MNNTPAHSLAAIVPGLVMVGLLATMAFGLRAFFPAIPLSPLMLAIALGMLWRNLFGVPARASAGITASLKRPLRLGIVLLGLQLTFGHLLEIGAAGLALLISCVVLTFVFTVLMGRVLRVDSGMTKLIAAGTSICGASAVVAANSVIRGRGESVAYALGVVTLYGTVVMFCFPMLGAMVGLGDQAYGLWVGAAVHEVAQVVAAAFAHGSVAGEYGTASKLARVLMLAPMIILLGQLLARRGNAGAAEVPVPWFAFGFIVMVAVASTGWMSGSVLAAATFLSQALLAIAMAAVGLETDLRQIRAEGWRPLALGGVATLFIATLAFTLVWFLHG
jgi:uncharacterized integral membrane protein (TIGR00698 family)